jgi:hypothetical protein
MKLSLLEMVQDILSDMDSDEVNSIDDTIESAQVTKILKSVYFEMIGNRNWPHLRKLIVLDSIGNTAYPNYLVVPSDVKEMVSFSYDKRKSTDTRAVIQEVHWKEPDDFLRYIASRNGDNANVDTVTDFGGSKLLILNDVAPTYYTSFDDVRIVTDSYDSVVDSTLQGSKTQCIAYVNPVWEHDNDFIPNLPIDAFPAFLAEAKSTCFINVKQLPNQKAEQKAGRQQRWLSRKAWKVHGGVKYDDYGRKSRR